MLHRFLEHRTQQLKEKNHCRTDKDPLPADVGGGIHHQFGAVQLQLYAHEDASQNEEHRRRE